MALGKREKTQSRSSLDGALFAKMCLLRPVLPLSTASHPCYHRCSNMLLVHQEMKCGYFMQFDVLNSNT